MRRREQSGFTLLEVMLGLALMALGIVVLIRSTAGNMFSSEEAHMMGVATDLARSKMYDIEEVLLKDGFTDTSQSQESEECFTDEGWPGICYSYKVEEPKLPSFDELQNMTMKKAEDMAGSAGSGSAGLTGSAGDMLAQAGSGALGGGGGALGGMLGMVGMFGGSQDIDAAAGGAMIQGQYSMFQEVLKVSVRKVILTVKWKVLGRDRDMVVVAFFTDPGAMNKTMLGGMTNALEASGGGSGSGSGSGSGTGSGSSSSGSSGRPARGGRGTTP